MDIQQAVSALVDGKNLSQQEMAGVMRQVMSGDATDAQIGGLLVGLRKKGETTDEIAGAAQVMRELATPVEVSCPHLVDLVGTGGDGANLPGYRDSIIEVRHCVVEDFVRGPDAGTEWPYCTGIMVSHRGADVENGTVRARVHHNEIRNIVNGIALGGAFLQRAEFFENKVIHCGIGFNFDTGSNRGVVIRDNEFVACVGGGSVNDGKRFVIRDNVFRLRAPDMPRFAYWHNGLRLWDHTRGFVVEGNRFVFDGESLPKARGVLLHGTSVGLRMFQDEGGEWQSQVDPHRFTDNLYSGLLPNLAGPQKADHEMHLVVGERAIHLTGITGQGDGIKFTWPDD